MTLKEIINGLKFTIIMFMQDPVTGEVYTKPKNELDKITVDACKGAIELLEQTRWIPVSERLPKCVVNDSRCSRDVLIMYDNGDMRVGFFVRDKVDGTERWIAYDDEFPIYFDAIAWMPLSELSELYKQEAEE